LSFRIFAFSLICWVLTGSTFAQTPPPSTDYEWELLSSNRTHFRDRTPAGQVVLLTPARAGIFSRKPKSSGEALTLYAEVAFVPGDTVRSYAASLDLGDASGVTATTMLDASELPSFWRFLDYAASTAHNIAATERAGTSVEYHTKGGLFIAFSQTGTAQQFVIRYPGSPGHSEITRGLTADQLSSLKELCDLAIYELKRQGANITSPAAIKP
jgi:hypothetical protein